MWSSNVDSIPYKHNKPEIFKMIQYFLWDSFFNINRRNLPERAIHLNSRHLHQKRHLNGKILRRLYPIMFKGIKGLWIIPVSLKGFTQQMLSDFHRWFWIKCINLINRSINNSQSICNAKINNKLFLVYMYLNYIE